MHILNKRVVRQSKSYLVADAFERLLQTGRRLLQEVASGATENWYFNDVRELLEKVPLTTDDYAVANRRLRNAIYYATIGETGAARYELATVVRKLSTLWKAIELRSD